MDESWLPQQPVKKGAGSQLYLSEKVAAQEKEIIEQALRECQGRVFGPSGAAAKLGIARSTLELKIWSLKIDKKRFRPIRELEGSRFPEITLFGIAKAALIGHDAETNYRGNGRRVFG